MAELRDDLDEDYYIYMGIIVVFSLFILFLTYFGGWRLLT